MDKVTLIIDGIEIKARRGEKILWAALDNGFYIPNLCALRQDIKPRASCRLCYVEIEGRNAPVTACTETARDAMRVTLNTPAIQKLRKTSFELLLSNNRVDCRSCLKNGDCELQNIASKLGLKLKLQRFRPIERNIPVDASHPLIIFDRNKCVLCGRCVAVCEEQGAGILGFAYKGIETRIAIFGDRPLAESGCNSCMACVAVCPVAALVRKSEPSDSVDTGISLTTGSIEK